MNPRYEKNMSVGDCVLREFLGRGAWGEVWKAFSTDFEKEVTIKIAEEKGREALQQEAKILSRLSSSISPRILKVSLDHDPPYLVREWVEGKTLREILQQNSPLPIPKAFEIANSLFSALRELHGQKVFHGDLKPENLLYQEKIQKILILDMGGSNFSQEELALSHDLADEEATSSHATFLYMAPELREKGAQVNGQSDLYSAGLIFFELFVGRLPRGMELPSEAREGVSSMVDEAFKKSVAPPERRYLEAQQALKDLNRKIIPTPKEISSKPGLWTIVRGTYPVSLGFRLFVILLCMSVFAGAIMYQEGESYENIILFKIHLGFLVGLWVYTFLGRINRTGSYLFSNTAAFILFLLWGCSFGFNIEKAEEISRKSVQSSLEKYFQFQKEGSLAGFKNILHPSLPLDQVIREHQKVLKLGTYQKYEEMKEIYLVKEIKKRTKHFSALLFYSQGKARGEFSLENMDPYSPEGKWLFTRILLQPLDSGPEVDLPPPLPTPILQWSDFERTISQTIEWDGGTISIHEFRHKKTGIEFVQIPCGRFERGGRTPDSKPIYEVSISSFLMSKYEITQKQWKDVMKTEPWVGQQNTLIGDSYPVVYVSWKEAREFCRRIGMRLPSEAEWEYACRAGSKTDYYWGDSVDLQYVWFSPSKISFAERVGQKIPNCFDLFDMSGNVAEWCEDSWSINYSSTPCDGSPFRSKEKRKVVRGGSWNSSASQIYSWSRSERDSSEKDSEVGFRCAVVVK